MLSYSKQTKEALLKVPEKKNCCRRMLEDMTAPDALTSAEAAERIAASPKHFKCQNCFSAFLRGLFLTYGSVTDPAKRYHLELSFPSKDMRDAAGGIISDNGFEMSSGERGARYILYIKDSAKIEEFFALIGANKAAFELINSKIVRELRGDANRRLNCDMANIRKSLTASHHSAEMLRRLSENGMLIRLPEELRETAKLRMENDEATLSELAAMHSVPMTKSGVKHRLDKIAAIVERLESDGEIPAETADNKQ